MVAVDLVERRDPYTHAPALRDELVQAAFRRGLLLLGCGESAIRFCPPLCVSAAQVETALDILGSVVAEHGAAALTA
jgi:4-aminobutyrate aminotransferase